MNSHDDMRHEAHCNLPLLFHFSFSIIFNGMTERASVSQHGLFDGKDPVGVAKIVAGALCQ